MGTRLPSLEPRRSPVSNASLLDHATARVQFPPDYSLHSLRCENKERTRELQRGQVDR